MHILYLHQYFVPPDGNGGTRSYEMARRLVKAGHQVTMITSSSFFPPHYQLSKRITHLEIEGISLRVIRVPYSNKLSYMERIKAFFEFALKAIVETAKTRSVDLVFATSTPLTIAVPAIFGKLWHKKPMVFEVRDLWPEVPIAMGVLSNRVTIWAAKLLEKWAYSNSTRVVALSQGMADGIVRAGYSGQKIAVIPNSCDVDLFRVSELEGEAFLEKHPYLKKGPLVTYTGTLGAVNGLDYMVDIASHMLKIDPSVRFLIVGDGKQKDFIVERAMMLGVLEKNLWILPPVAKKEIPGILSASTVATSFVINLPALWNNSANKFFDTLAGSRPMVINHEGWQADTLRKYQAGLVLPPDNPFVAARELCAFLNDNGKLIAARNSASLLADSEFNRDILANRLRRLLEECI